MLSCSAHSDPQRPAKDKETGSQNRLEDEPNTTIERMNKAAIGRSNSLQDGCNNMGLDCNLRTEKPVVARKSTSSSVKEEETCEYGAREESPDEGRQEFPLQFKGSFDTNHARSSLQRTLSTGVVTTNFTPDMSVGDMGTTVVEMYHKSVKRGSLTNRTQTDGDENDIDDSERGHCVIEDIKGKFGNAKPMKPKWTSSRRSSLSSIGSLCSQVSLANPFGSVHGSESVANNDDPYRSSSTLPVTNVVKTKEMKKRRQVVKTEQMIESLVWFSFHVPRTILEDLIANELGQWENKDCSTTGGARTSLDKLLPSIQDSGDEGSVSSLSENEANSAEQQVFGTTTANQRPRGVLSLPTSSERKAALLFVDMSGFTKLSCLLDVESLSKVINSYFDMIASEVILYGGDILKFAGDAFFAEWRVLDDAENQSTCMKNPLSDLNASLVSIGERAFDNSDMPPLANCVLLAAKCGASIVKKFSDYRVTTASNGGTSSEAMLNLHCGIGAGDLVGLHVGDYRADVEESVELRREFLLLGEPIDQVCSS